MAFAPASGSVVVYQGSSAGASSPSGSPVRALAVVVAGPLPNGTYDLDCARGVVAGELLPAAGEAVEYHSSSLQAWIPGRVLRPGAAAGTLDLDCKEAADLRRVRLLQAPPSSAAGARDAHAPAAASGVGGGGPPKLQPGDHCFYRSSTHGWLAAQVQHFSAEDGTYDLSVKPRVRPENIHCIQEGSVVEYHSASQRSWIPATVLRRGLGPETFDLDCKEKVNITRLRPPADLPPSCTRGSAPVQPASPGHAGDWACLPTAGRPPLAGSAASSAPSVSLAEKLSRLQKAVMDEDQQTLRQALESQSALRLAGEEWLDRAGHALWALEARPGAVAELRRAARARDRRALEAALEAAAVCEVPPEELEAASRVLQDLKAPLWRYQALDGKHADVRVNPDVDGPRTRFRINSGDVFCVSEEQAGKDGVLYLRLADGRGWMFDRKPGLGNMCTRFLLPPVADAPGPYLIIHDQAALTQNAPVSPADSTRELIGRVRASTPVEVLEVQRCQVLGREVLRGLLRDPPGWVTILDYDSGERWALAMSSAQG